MTGFASLKSRDSFNSVPLVQDVCVIRVLIFASMLAVMRGRDVSMSTTVKTTMAKVGKEQERTVGKSRDYADTRLARPTAVLQKMVPVLVDLDRRVASLEDRSTFVVFLRSEDAKKMVRDVRETWKKGEKDRRDALAKKWNDEPAGAHILAPHPLGGSLRVCILRTCLELMLECLNRQPNVDNSAVELLNKVLEVSPEKMAEVIFRAKPRHPKSRQDKPWVWACMFADGLSSIEKSTMSSPFGARKSSCLHNTPKMDRWSDGCVTGGITRPRIQERQKI